MGIIKILKQINDAATFNLWHVRVGGISMTLFVLFVVGEKFVSKYVPMEPAVATVVSEVMSFIACAILGGAMIVPLCKLSPRRRWAIVATIACGLCAGLIVDIVFDLYDGEREGVTRNLFTLGISAIVALVALVLWRLNLTRLKRIKFIRSLEQPRHREF